MASPGTSYRQLAPSRRSSQAQIPTEVSISGRTSTDGRVPQHYSSSSQHSHDSYLSRPEHEGSTIRRVDNSPLTGQREGYLPSHLSTSTYEGRPVGSDGPRSAPSGGVQQGVYRATSMSTPTRAASTPDPRTTPRSSQYHPSIQRDFSSSPPSSSRLPPPPSQQYGHHLPPGSDHSHSSHSHSPLNPNPNAQHHPYAHSQHSRSQQSQKSQQQLNERPSTSQMSHKSSRNALGQTTCGVCQQPVLGQFVRAMGNVYHLDCFRCKVRDWNTPQRS